MGTAARPAHEHGSVPHPSYPMSTATRLPHERGSVSWIDAIAFRERFGSIPFREHFQVTQFRSENAFS